MIGSPIPRSLRAPSSSNPDIFGRAQSSNAISPRCHCSRPRGKKAHRQSTTPKIPGRQFCGQDFPIVVVVIHQDYVGHVAPPSRRARLVSEFGEPNFNEEHPNTQARPFGARRRYSSIDTRLGQPPR